MNREYRKAALAKALQKSLDKNLYYVLLHPNGTTFITNQHEIAQFYTSKHRYRVYAKCQNGVMIL